MIKKNNFKRLLWVSFLWIFTITGGILQAYKNITCAQTHIIGSSIALYSAILFITGSTVTIIVLKIQFKDSKSILCLEIFEWVLALLAISCTCLFDEHGKLLNIYSYTPDFIFSCSYVSVAIIGSILLSNIFLRFIREENSKKTSSNKKSKRKVLKTKNSTDKMKSENNMNLKNPNSDFRAAIE